MATEKQHTAHHTESHTDSTPPDPEKQRLEREKLVQDGIKATKEAEEKNLKEVRTPKEGDSVPIVDRAVAGLPGGGPAHIPGFSSGGLPAEAVAEPKKKTEKK